MSNKFGNLPVIGTNYADMAPVADTLFVCGRTRSAPDKNFYTAKGCLDSRRVP